MGIQSEPRKIRFIMCIELIAYYIAAPYIILLALDDKRGLLDAMTSHNFRLFGYACLIGIYPFLQIIVSPYIGRKLDEKKSKISILRNIHLANSVCYLLLAWAAFRHDLVMAITALAIPGVVGCAAPVGKSLIASLTDSTVRVKEFAKLALMKGVVKLFMPLCGAFAFEWLLDRASFTPFFLVSSLLSLFCFCFSFSFKPLVLPCSKHSEKERMTTLSLFFTIIGKNASLFFVFVLLLTGFLVFVKFTPLIMIETFKESPSYVNYFFSLIGLVYSLNQYMLVRFSKQIEQACPVIFVTLSMCTLMLCISSSSVLWFLALFGSLFCFSSLSTCVEARLSLQAVFGKQGTLLGVLYSIENWSYLLAPVIGSLLASFEALYPLYFVTLSVLLAALLFASAHATLHAVKQ